MNLLNSSILFAAITATQVWTWSFVGITFALYLYIGWRSRVKNSAEFYVAGQGVPAIANGAATAADWMSAASFISMAGLISFLGSDGSVYLMGWTGGYVLLALLLAPYLRKFGHYTVPDFIGARYYSETARVVAAICAIFVSITYVAGQMKGVGVVFSRFLELELTYGVIIGMVIVGFFAVVGGMKGITWTQVAQYFVLILAFLIPSVALSNMLTDSPIPQLGFVTSDIAERLNLALRDLGEQEYTQPFTKFSQLNVFCIAAALMFGTAGLPHVIVRFYTVKDVRAARYSAVWAILFIAILYTSAPALGMFARYNLIQNLNGAKIRSSQVTIGDGAPETFAYPDEKAAAEEYIAIAKTKAVATAAKKDTPKVVYSLSSPTGTELTWANQWQNTGLLTIDDFDGDGAISLQIRDTPEQKKPRCEAEIDKDIIVLSTPEVAQLPPWVIALVAAGGLAAALSTAAGLLLVISSSLAHDLFVRYVTPNASESQKVLIGRIAIIFGVAVAGYFGINPPGFVGEVVAFAFGLAAASFFPVIFLGIFYKPTNRIGATLGMITGLVFTMTYIVLCTSNKLFPFLYDDPKNAQPLLTEANYLFAGWFGDQGIKPQGIGTVGMILNFIVTLTVSSVTAPPPQEVLDLVESVRVPTGAGAASDH